MLFLGGWTRFKRLNLIELKSKSRKFNNYNKSRNDVPDLGTKISPKSFQPKWSLVKSVPARSTGSRKAAPRWRRRCTSPRSSASRRRKSRTPIPRHRCEEQCYKLTGVDVVILIFCDFGQFFCEKIGTFLESHCYDQTFALFSFVLSQIRQFLPFISAKIFLKS
jgi:hypothetical protein